MNDDQRMTIEHECERLVMRYCHLVDGGEAGRLPELFTDDGVWASPGTRLVGRDELSAVMNHRLEVSIDGAACGRADIPVYLSTFTSTGISLGMDHGSPVSGRYEAPFTFTGTLHDVTIQLPGGSDPEVDEAVARAEWARQ